MPVKPQSVLPGVILRTYEAWCGVCSTWLSARLALPKFKAGLRKRGWVKDKRVGWMCSDCAKRRKTGEA